MSKINPPREFPQLPSFDESTAQWLAAREKHFPQRRRAGVALALALGIALLLASMLMSKQSVGTTAEGTGSVDTVYMTGAVLVYLVLLYLPWVLVHMPAKPMSAAARESIPTGTGSDA